MTKIGDRVKARCPYCKEILTDENVVKKDKIWVHDNCAPPPSSVRCNGNGVPLNDDAYKDISAEQKEVQALLMGLDLTTTDISKMCSIDMELYDKYGVCAEDIWKK